MNALPVLTRAETATARRSAIVLTLWGSAVAAASASGLLGRVTPIGIAPLIGAGIAAPTIAYLRLPRMRALARAIGPHRLSVLHAWRIGAAFTFAAYDRRGTLPPRFAKIAGNGDLIAGVAALLLLAAPKSRTAHVAFNILGFADFVSALGTGIGFTLARDSRMASLAKFPLALIPLFGVGLSGAAHLIAFDLLAAPNTSQTQNAGTEASSGRDRPRRSGP